MTFDVDMHCSDCDCTAGSCNEELKKTYAMHMVCAHACPAIIKIATLMCQFVADDMCYDLAVHLTNIKFYDKCNLDQIECMRQSVITLT